MADKLDPEWVKTVRSLNHTARGRRVLEYLLEHGTINLYEIETTLGEAHAPSAIRDVKDRGVPIVQTRKVSAGGKMRQEYALEPNAPLRTGMIGRTGFSKDFKNRLIKHYGTRCAICGWLFEPRYLQPDHRVPQRVGGDQPDNERNVGDYMPICGPCNRKKSFECERCPNWELRDIETCQTCYWAKPEGGYTHIATSEARRLDLGWSGTETADYDALVSIADAKGLTVAELVRELIRSFNADPY